MEKNQITSDVNQVKKQSLQEKAAKCLQFASFFYSCFLPKDEQISLSKKTLVLDLDETLVHSGLGAQQADLTIQVEIDVMDVDMFVFVRPGAKEFIIKMAEYYEIVIFTASLSKYANLVLNLLDEKKIISRKFFRNDCNLSQGSYIKDLKKVRKNMKDIIIVDNCSDSYQLQPENAIAIKSWYSDKSDNELFKLMPLLIELSKVEDVRKGLQRLNSQESVKSQNESYLSKSQLQLKSSLKQERKNKSFCQ